MSVRSPLPRDDKLEIARAQVASLIAAKQAEIKELQASIRELPKAIPILEEIIDKGSHVRFRRDRPKWDKANLILSTYGITPLPSWLIDWSQD